MTLYRKTHSQLVKLRDTTQNSRSVSTRQTCATRGGNCFEQPPACRGCADCAKQPRNCGDAQGISPGARNTPVQEETLPRTQVEQHTHTHPKNLTRPHPETAQDELGNAAPMFSTCSFQVVRPAVGSRCVKVAVRTPALALTPSPLKKPARALLHARLPQEVK